MDEYQRVLLEKITRIEGVIGVHSSFVLRKAVDSTALPLTYLERGPGRARPARQTRARSTRPARARTGTVRPTRN
jgi:hypothetical protein